ncbi:MAG: ATP-binding cassette domain-containing protein, partial [Planctomycetia bacterium]|nr:ATP-binding cassette domain-containing protein [Planctomycetia bacterium]
DLRGGDTLAVIGESGCGKTVLLKTMIGLVRPSQGTIRFEGRDLAAMGDRELAHLRTRYGFVFQGAALFDSYTIADNVAFPLHEHTRLPADEVRRIVAALIDEVGLPRTVLEKKPVQLSGGMRKRAGLARALALDPQLVLYDEPTTGLDPIMSDVINELILRAGRRPGVTSVVVTHDMNTARKVADRVIMLYPASRLRPGEPQVVFSGTPAAHEFRRCPGRGRRHAGAQERHPRGSRVGRDPRRARRRERDRRHRLLRADLSRRTAAHRHHPAGRRRDPARAGTDRAPPQARGQGRGACRRRVA